MDNAKMKETNIATKTSTKKKRPPEEKCLDYLAWLMESNSSDCAAICLVNKHLLIAENSITSSTKKTTENYAHVKYVIQYISSTTSKNNQESTTEALLKKILLQKIRGKMQGALVNSFSDEERENIISIIIQHAKEKDSEIFKDNLYDKSLQKKLKKEIKHGEAELGGIIATVARSLRYVSYLRKNLTSDLKEAIQVNEERRVTLSEYGGVNFTDAKWLRSGDQPGYAILAFPKPAQLDKKNEKENSKNLGTIHAELKIIDFLLASRILTQSEGSKFFIGISKRCCPRCDQAIKSVNEIKKDAIAVSGIHEIDSEERWSRPVFLMKGDENSENNYKKGLHLAEKNKSKYYIMKEGDFPKSSDQNIDFEKEYQNSSITFLNRDDELIRKIREDFDSNIPQKKKPIQRAMSYLSSSSESENEDKKESADDYLDKVTNSLLEFQLFTENHWAIITDDQKNVWSKGLSDISDKCLELFSSLTNKTNVTQEKTQYSMTVSNQTTDKVNVDQSKKRRLDLSGFFSRKNDQPESGNDTDIEEVDNSNSPS